MPPNSQKGSFLPPKFSKGSFLPLNFQKGSFLPPNFQKRFFPAPFVSSSLPARGDCRGAASEGRGARHGKRLHNTQLTVPHHGHHPQSCAGRRRASRAPFAVCCATNWESSLRTETVMCAGVRRTACVRGWVVEMYVHKRHGLTEEETVLSGSRGGALTRLAARFAARQEGRFVYVTVLSRVAEQMSPTSHFTSSRSSVPARPTSRRLSSQRRAASTS